MDWSEQNVRGQCAMTSVDWWADRVDLATKCGFVDWRDDG